MRTVGVTWGAGKREELIEAGADWVIKSMEELPGLLATSQVGVIADA
jgi:phosphoglycolate phosphatase-like HAD superfamily hydrolase